MVRSESKARDPWMESGSPMLFDQHEVPRSGKRSLGERLHQNVVGKRNQRHRYQSNGYLQETLGLESSGSEEDIHSTPISVAVKELDENIASTMNNHVILG